jgi:hypothetical protein
MFTRFWDMHSGGSLKEKWQMIYIEAPESEAKIIFYNRFGHHPYRITCSCCGEDYSINECDTLKEATAFHRGCDWNDEGYIESPRAGHQYQTIEQYQENSDVLIIRKKDITSEEREGTLPEEPEEEEYFEDGE